MATTTPRTMDLFFYIKNSSDYPPGQILSDKFGYETVSSADGTSTETVAIFNYSIKDLYNKLTSPKAIGNLYQLNKIDGNVAVDNKDPISTTNVEYTSEIVINDGKQSIYDDVNPDYDFTKYDDYVNGTLNRSHIFWRKMFSLFEFLKYNESNIVNKVEPTGIDKEKLRTSNPDALSNYNAESVVGKYIMAFVANKTQFTTSDTKAGDVYNDYRKTYFNPIYADTWTIQGDDEKSDLLWDKLNILYSTKSASVTTSAKYTNRIDSIKFTIQYYDAKTDDNQIWTFNLYFTPDAIIEAKAGSAFKVWTYNDADLDDQYSDTSGNFNIYDNDYANTLRKNESYNKSFIVSKDEMASEIAKKLVEITKDGLYSGYVEYKTTRVSPYIEKGDSEAGTKDHVVWDNDNKTIQTFYIFYPSTEPTATEQQAAVQSYLKQLHANCHPQTTDTEGNVKFIGHGTTNEELNLFLSKMYPELFSLSSITIVPIINDRFYGDSAYSPANYIHPISIYDICRTIKLVPGFTNFGYNTDGSYTEQDDNSRAGVEVFYLGGVRDTEGKLTLDFPIICTRAGTSSNHPFTDINGMNAYRQMEYNGTNVPTKTPDLLQYILIRLFTKMFIAGVDSSKKSIGQIGDVMITYSYESGYDPDSVLLGKNVANVARFTINSIEYAVYAQQTKNFGSLTSSETIDSNGSIEG